MMKVLIIILFSFSSQCFCQNKLVDLIPNKADKLSSFIPFKWLLIDSAVGDFNKDGIKDYAFVVIDSINEKVLEDVNRSLVIIEGLKSGYQLSGYCDSAILCFACGGVHGDPYQGMNFYNNILEVSHYGGSSWRWAITDKFRLQDKNWFLIGETRNNYRDVKQCEKLNDFAGTDYDDENFVTGQYEVKKISENCKLLENRKGKKKVQPLVSLTDFNIDN